MYQADSDRYNSMEYVRFGRSGLKLPKICLGLWHNFGSNASYDNMKAMCETAFDSGITHFDIANNYGPVAGSAEENFGRILKKDMGAYRDEMIISTKAGYYMWEGPYGEWGSRKYLMASIDQSLKRLGLDYVDIFYHHRPDPETPLEETMYALDSIVRSGKALYVGISNYDSEGTRKATQILRELKTPFVINQSKYSMLVRNIEYDNLFATAKDEGIGVIAFCPLAQGLLTDKYISGIPEDSRIRTDGRFLKESAVSPELVEKLIALNSLAKERGQSLAQMALAWSVRPGAADAALIGASRPSQIVENCRMLENSTFTPDELELIEGILNR